MSLSSIPSRPAVWFAPEMKAWRIAFLIELALLIGLCWALLEPQALLGAAPIFLASAGMLPLAQAANVLLARRRSQVQNRAVQEFRHAWLMMDEFNRARQVYWLQEQLQGEAW